MAEGDEADRPVRHPPGPRSGAAVAPPSADRQRIVAAFGPNQRAGYWEPAERVEALSLFGEVKLDFREANLYEGVTEVQCTSIFGSVRILAPAHVVVDANGAGIFGGFEHRSPKEGLLRNVSRRLLGESPDAGAPEPDPEAEPAVLRIRGFAVFGNVVVQQRAPR